MDGRKGTSQARHGRCKLGKRQGSGCRRRATKDRPEEIGQIRYGRKRLPRSGGGLLQGRRFTSLGRLPAAAFAGNQCDKIQCGGAQKNSFGKATRFFLHRQGVPWRQGGRSSPCGSFGGPGEPRTRPPEQWWFLPSGHVPPSQQRFPPLTPCLSRWDSKGLSPLAAGGSSFFSSFLLRPFTPWAWQRRRRRPVL